MPSEHDEAPFPPYGAQPPPPPLPPLSASLAPPPPPPPGARASQVDSDSSRYSGSGCSGSGRSGSGNRDSECSGSGYIGSGYKGARCSVGGGGDAVGGPATCASPDRAHSQPSPPPSPPQPCSPRLSLPQPLPLTRASPRRASRQLPPPPQGKAAWILPGLALSVLRVTGCAVQAMEEHPTSA